MVSTGITSPSSEKKPETRFKRAPISSSHVPVEVFILFLKHNTEKFTISQLIKKFYATHSIDLRFERMQQIVGDLVITGKVYKEYAVNEKKNTVAYYSFVKIS